MAAGYLRCGGRIPPSQQPHLLSRGHPGRACAGAAREVVMLTTDGTTAATSREYSASSAVSTCTSFGSMRSPSAGVYFFAPDAPGSAPPLSRCQR